MLGEIYSGQPPEAGSDVTTGRRLQRWNPEVSKSYLCFITQSGDLYSARCNWWRRKWQHSSVLAWRIPGMGEPGGLLSMGSHRVRHDWSDLAAAAPGAIGAVCKGAWKTEHALVAPGNLHPFPRARWPVYLLVLGIPWLLSLREEGTFRMWARLYSLAKPVLLAPNSVSLLAAWTLGKKFLNSPGGTWFSKEVSTQEERFMSNLATRAWWSLPS